jgi:hypothetical protein
MRQPYTIGTKALPVGRQALREIFRKIADLFAVTHQTYQMGNNQLKIHIEVTIILQKIILK